MSQNQTFQFTQEGFDDLKKELEQLQNRRPQVVINLTNAREQGDLSENAGYHAAKEELSQIDSRTREIKYLLRVGKAIKQPDGHAVSFGSRVVVEVNGQTLQFQIVEELEANPARGKISTDSPIGKSVLGKRLGDVVEVSTPTGTIKLKVAKID